MNADTKLVTMKFCGTTVKRNIFLKEIRAAVTKITGEKMTLDALIHEIAKNIYDHARGEGSMTIIQKDNLFEFEIKDDGQESYDFDLCKNNSASVSNGINYGIGLNMIFNLASALKIELKIDTSKGFYYSGVYTPLNMANN